MGDKEGEEESARQMYIAYRNFILPPNDFNLNYVATLEVPPKYPLPKFFSLKFQNIGMSS